MKTLQYAIIVTAALTTGCGGGGGGGNSTPIPSPFAGAYTGTWSSPELDASGTLAATIATDGKFTGTINNGDDAGTISGTVSNSGSTSGSAKYPGQPTYPIRGTITRASANQLRFTGRQTVDGDDYTLTAIFNKA